MRAIFLLALWLALPASASFISKPGGGGGSGTVTSVGLGVDTSLSSIFNVSGSPVTSSGTLTLSLATQAANLVLAGPTTGSAAAPTFRLLVGADLPAPSSSTLGGVKSAAAVSHQWIDSISTGGVPHLSQPSVADVTGAAPTASPIFTGSARFSKLTSSSASAPISGQLNLAHGDVVTWRNNADSGDISLGVNVSDQLTFNGSAVGAAWGSITGTLSSQTDLNTALSAKAPTASPALTGTPTVNGYSMITPLREVRFIDGFNSFTPTGALSYVGGAVQNGDRVFFPKVSGGRVYKAIVSGGSVTGWTLETDGLSGTGAPALGDMVVAYDQGSASSAVGRWPSEVYRYTVVGWTSQISLGNAEIYYNTNAGLEMDSSSFRLNSNFLQFYSDTIAYSDAGFNYNEFRQATSATASTTDATPTELSIYGSTIGVPPAGIFILTLHILAKAGSDYWMVTREIHGTSNGTAITVISTNDVVTEDRTAGASGWALSYKTNGKVEATGAAATTIKWSVVMDYKFNNN